MKNKQTGSKLQNVPGVDFRFWHNAGIRPKEWVCLVNGWVEEMVAADMPTYPQE